MSSRNYDGDKIVKKTSYLCLRTIESKRKYKKKKCFCDSALLRYNFRKSKNFQDVPQRKTMMSLFLPIPPQYKL